MHFGKPSKDNIGHDSLTSYDEVMRKVKNILENDKDRLNLPQIPLHKMPIYSCCDAQDSVLSFLKEIQQFIISLQYNHTKTMYFHPKKTGGVKQVCELAETVLAASVPIQCIEAAYLGVYFTQPIRELQRFPLFFRSFIQGKVYKHIVLAIKVGDTWGAIGISRKNTLMFKDFIFKSLSSLVLEFKACYEKCGHRLLTVKTGLPFTHNSRCTLPLRMKLVKVIFDKRRDWLTDLVSTFDNFANHGETLRKYHESSGGRLPSNFRLKYCIAYDDYHHRASIVNGGVVKVAPPTAIHFPLRNHNMMKDDPVLRSSEWTKEAPPGATSNSDVFLLPKKHSINIKNRRSNHDNRERGDMVPATTSLAPSATPAKPLFDSSAAFTFGV